MKMKIEQRAIICLAWVLLESRYDDNSFPVLDAHFRECFFVYSRVHSQEGKDFAPVRVQILPAMDSSFHCHETIGYENNFLGGMDSAIMNVDSEIKVRSIAKERIKLNKISLNSPTY
mmetsp:Transcript_34381/g.79494  ORF Transcript_34381/g.79494 Transcript_34381/m.79494 type:complete len:117 (+) Transcript_34381:975-1325(+)